MNLQTCLTAQFKATNDSVRSNVMIRSSEIHSFNFSDHLIKTFRIENFTIHIQIIAICLG